MKLLLLALVLFSPHAKADVLFIDLNNSPEEVKAAREAAAKSKRQFILIPDPSAKDRQEIATLTSQKDALNKILYKKCKTETPTCDETRKKYEAVSKVQREKIDKVRFDPEKLEELLADRERQKNPLTSVVISGHDGTGHFSGQFGSIGDQQIAKIFDKYPSSKEGLRSLHLWGCYTTSPGSLMLNWKKHFPNASLVAGFEGRAPLNDKPAGWHYLKGVLAREPELLAAQDHGKLKNLLRQIPGATMVTAAVAVCDDYASNKESYNLSELTDRCKLLKVEIEKKLPDFQCYLRAEEDRCKDPPTDVGSGAVRAFYEILHKSAACTGISQDDIFRTVSRDQAIRLVFAKEVQKNFRNIYRSQIAESDLFLESLGAPPELRFSNLEKLSRQDLLKRAEELRAFIESHSPDPTQDPGKMEFTLNHAKIYALNGLQRALTDTMASLNPNCVPFNWTEPDMREPSQCIDATQLGTGAVGKTMADKKILASSAYEKMRINLSDRIRADTKTGGNEVLAASQSQVWKAMMGRIDLYAYNDPVPDAALLAQVNKQLSWAEALVEKSKQGVINPTKDPAVVKLAREYNLDVGKKDLKQYEESLVSSKAELAKLTKQDDRAYHLEQIESTEINLSQQKLKLKLLEGMLAGENPEEGELKKIRFELGESLWSHKIYILEKSIANHNREIEMYRQPNSTQQEYVRSLEASNSFQQQTLDELKNDKTKTVDKFVHRATDLPPFYRNELESAEYEAAMNLVRQNQSGGGIHGGANSIPAGVNPMSGGTLPAGGAFAGGGFMGGMGTTPTNTNQNQTTPYPPQVPGAPTQNEPTPPTRENENY